MRDKTARDTRFPVACARCGGRISEPVAFCPHCGAHARFALAGATPAPEPAEFPEPPSPATGRRVEPSMQSFAADDFEDQRGGALHGFAGQLRVDAALVAVRGIGVQAV